MESRSHLRETTNKTLDARRFENKNWSPLSSPTCQYPIQAVNTNLSDKGKFPYASTAMSDYFSSVRRSVGDAETEPDKEDSIMTDANDHKEYQSTFPILRTPRLVTHYTSPTSRPITFGELDRTYTKVFPKVTASSASLRQRTPILATLTTPVPPSLASSVNQLSERKEPSTIDASR